MERRKRFRFFRRLIRFFMRRRAQIRARRKKYSKIPKAKDMDLWREKDELMPADYTDYRWRAQGKHHEKHQPYRGGSHADYPGLAPGHERRQKVSASPDNYAKNDSPRTRGSMRNQEQEALHAGHHSQCACMVVKQYTQEMHQKSTSGARKESHRKPQLQNIQPDQSRNRDHDINSPPRSEPGHPEPQVYIPISPNNPWITGEKSMQSSSKTGTSASQITAKIGETIAEGVEATSRLKHHAQALRSQPYENLDNQTAMPTKQQYLHHHPHHHSPSKVGDCGPSCACASVKEFTRQMNENHPRISTSVYPTSMPMRSTNPFIETATDVAEVVSTQSKRARDVAKEKLSESSEALSRHKHHIQASYGYDRLDSDNKTNTSHRCKLTNPFLVDTSQTMDTLSKKAKGVASGVTSAFQQDTELASSVEYRVSDQESYRRLPSDTSGDFQDSSDHSLGPRSGEFEDMIDGSDHSRMESDMINSLLDEVDESTFHELKDLDQSSLCELEDLCQQLQTIIEEESDGEEDGPKRGHRKQRRRRSTEQVPQVKIPVAVVPPQTFIPVERTAEQITRRGKYVGKKVKDVVIQGGETLGRARYHAKSGFSYEKIDSPSKPRHQLEGRMAIDYPMTPVTTSSGVHEHHGESQHAHEHGRNCACLVVRRYTAEMEKRERAQSRSRPAEKEDQYGVPQVKIQISPHTRYIAEANARFFEEKTGNIKGTVGRVKDELQNKAEAVTRVGAPVKGNVQYEKINSFEDDFNQMAINEIIKQDRLRMNEDRKTREMKRSVSLPEQRQLQQAFTLPQGWVQFSQEQTQPPSVLRGESARRENRPSSEPVPQIVEDPVTGIRIYKALKKPRRHSHGPKEQVRPASVPSTVYVMSRGGQPGRHSYPQNTASSVAHKGFTHNASVSDPLSVTLQKQSGAYNKSILRQKHHSSHHDMDSKTHTCHILQADVHSTKPARHSLPTKLQDDSSTGLSEQQKRAQSFHEDPQSRARKHKDIESWVDSVTPWSKKTGGNQLTADCHSEATRREIWSRDYHETNENQLNEYSRNAKLKRKKSKKKKLSILQMKDGMKWVQYNSLVDLSQGAPEYDDGWEDEEEERKIRKKDKRRALRKKTRGGFSKALRFLMGGVYEVSKQGVYYPTTYYNNKRPHHRPRH